MSRQNKEIERRLIEEVWNRANYDIVDELVARDYVGHSTTPEDETRGREGYKAFYASLHEAFPDFAVTIEDQIAEGDRVVTRWTARGTHLGPFRGIPPTGNHAAITGITVERFANGKVVECWTNADELGLLRLLGVIPEMQKAA